MGLQKDAALIIPVTAWQAPVRVGKQEGWGGGGGGGGGGVAALINPNLLNKILLNEWLRVQIMVMHPICTCSCIQDKMDTLWFIDHWNDMSNQTQTGSSSCWACISVFVTSLPPYTDMSTCLMCHPASICCPPECLHMSSSTSFSGSKSCLSRSSS